MRIGSAIAVLTIGLGASPAAAAQPQLEAVMTISGIPDRIAVRADRTDWTQVEGMADPRDVRGSGIDSLVGSRTGSLLTSRGGPAAGGDRGRAEMTDFTITKDVDKASPKLDLACTSGERIGEVVLEIEHAGGARGDRLVITMRNVVISRVDPQPAAAREPASEVVTFRCESLEWVVQPAAAISRSTPRLYSATPRPP